MNIKLSDILNSKVKIGLHNSQKSSIDHGFWPFDNDINLYEPSGYSYIEKLIKIPNIDSADFDSKYISFSIGPEYLQFNVSVSSETVDSYFLLIEITGNLYIISGSMDKIYDLGQIDTIKIIDIGFSIDNVKFDQESKDMIVREML